MKRFLLLIPVAAVVAVVAIAAGEDFPADVAPYEDFQDFDLYYLGAEFEGLPLTHVDRRKDEPTFEEPLAANWVTFIYGDCEPIGDTGCPAPLEVQVWPASVRNRGVQPVAPDGEPGVRGVPAAFYEGGDRLELATGRSTVVLFGFDSAQLLRAAEELRGINVAVGPDDPLPPPASG